MNSMIRRQKTFTALALAVSSVATIAATAAAVAYIPEYSIQARVVGGGYAIAIATQLSVSLLSFLTRDDP